MFTYVDGLLKYKDASGQWHEADVIKGESAYQAAVRLGIFSGTESEYYNKITNDRDGALSQINAKLTEVLSAIDTKKQQTLADIPDDYTTLSGDVSDLKSAIANNQYQSYDYTMDSVSGYWVTSGTTGTVISDTPASSNTGVRCIQIPVVQGDSFEIGLGLNQSSTSRIWTLIDNDRKQLERSSGGTGNVDFRSHPIQLEITNSSAKYLLVNYNPVLYPNGYIVRTDTALPKKIKDIYNYIDDSATVLETSRFEIGSIYNSGSNAGTDVDESSRIRTVGYIPCETGTVEVDCSHVSTYLIHYIIAYNDNAFVKRMTATMASKVAFSCDGTFNRFRMILKKSNNADFTEEEANSAYIPYTISTNEFATEAKEKIAVLSEQVENAQINSHEYQYVFPKWAEVFGFEDQSDYIGDSATFSALYNLFHGLAVDYPTIIEETNIGSAYNIESSETVPAYISTVQDGGMYMFHVLHPTNGSLYVSKYKRLKLFLLSGLHGGERKSIYDCYLLLNGIATGTPFSRGLSNIAQFVDLYVVPLANPSGIQANTRTNANGINLNRDFGNPYWKSSANDGIENANSQWETRVIEYAINEIKPHAFVDHHTSSGNSETEEGGAKFMTWGSSPIKAVSSLFEENVLECSPYVRNKYISKLSNYNFPYGHTEDEVPYPKGTSANYAYLVQGCISVIVEVVMRLKWDFSEGAGYIFGYDEEGQNQIMTVDYFFFMNVLLKFIQLSVDYLNNHVSYLEESL